MVIKFFKTGTNSINHATNYLIKEPTAKVLRGNLEVTKKIAQSLTFKHKYLSGAITFEEKSISDKIKIEAMDELEKALFCGLSKEQYNISFVEHCDKGRTEIHFLAPRVELSTGKNFQPYYDKKDRQKMIYLRDYINSKHGLSNPMEAERREVTQRVESRYKLSKRQQTKKEINKALQEEITRGYIKSRDDVIDFLEDINLKIGRKGKDYLTIITDENKRIRLKGAIYHEDFTTTARLTETARAEEREHTATTPAELTELRTKLERITQRHGEQNRAKYNTSIQQPGEQRAEAKQDNTREVTRREQEAQRLAKFRDLRKFRFWYSNINFSILAERNQRLPNQTNQNIKSVADTARMESHGQEREQIPTSKLQKTGQRGEILQQQERNDTGNKAKREIKADDKRRFKRQYLERTGERERVARAKNNTINRLFAQAGTGAKQIFSKCLQYTKQSLTSDFKKVGRTAEYRRERTQTQRTLTSLTKWFNEFTRHSKSIFRTARTAKQEFLKERQRIKNYKEQQKHTPEPENRGFRFKM